MRTKWKTVLSGSQRCEDCFKHNSRASKDNKWENVRDGKSLCKKHSFECGKWYVHGTGQTPSFQQYGNVGGVTSKEEFTAALLHCWCLRPKPLLCVSFATVKGCWDGGFPCCSSHSISRCAIHKDVSWWSGKWQHFNAGCLSQGVCCPDDCESSETHVATGQDRWWNTTLTTTTPLVMMVSGGPELGNRRKNAFTITH